MKITRPPNAAARVLLRATMRKAISQDHDLLQRLAPASKLIWPSANPFVSSIRMTGHRSPRGAGPPPAAAVSRVAMIGSCMPRRCGIATFTSDLGDALCAASPAVECVALAMNDPGRRYDYPARVRFEIAETSRESYRRAADFLNINNVAVVSLQHEYGIFGGKGGSHIVELMRELRMPIVTTLHTVLADPSDEQRAAMDEVVALSERVVVMSQLGKELLADVHSVDPAKIVMIPHGIPVLQHDPASKERIGVEDRRVLLTFGLLSPDKGIENVIDALPEILLRFPDVVYVVLGATHPHIREREGEAYRIMLETRARRLGVDSNVIFHNRFVSSRELADFLSAAEIYITPYLKAEQITSGTLAYAVGSGKAVVSTPYWYAKELLAEGRGALVGWRDAASIAHAVNDLLADEERRLAMCRAAAAYGEDMVWSSVARSYLATFDDARASHKARARSAFRAKTLASGVAELPELQLAHLRRMTDDTGVLQHAAYDVPRYEDGYCLDDNARALIVTTLAVDGGPEDHQVLRDLGGRYLAFVRHAWNAPVGRFRNFMSFDRRWLESRGSEDSHGRALWALGTVVGRSTESGRQRLCGELFCAALPVVTELTSPRAWAFALLGIEEYLRAFRGDCATEVVREELTRRLQASFEACSSPEWVWFENGLTYCNARLSQAMLVSGVSMERDDLVDVGLRSLGWLTAKETTADGYFAPIGSDGFHQRGGRQARFDQQPVEATGTIAAALAARRTTGDTRWTAIARRAFDWFLGQNERQAALYDASSGGCRDGLQEDRVNLNQGAESTLAFHLALLEMRAADRLLGEQEILIPNHVLPELAQ